MSMRWFGTDWNSPMNQECEQIPTPVGTSCLRCSEPIEPEDSGIVDAGGATLHYECFIRGIVGSARHQQKRCACFGFPELDSADFNVHDDARAALRYYESQL